MLLILSRKERSRIEFMPYAKYFPKKQQYKGPEADACVVSRGGRIVDIILGVEAGLEPRVKIWLGQTAYSNK